MPSSDLARQQFVRPKTVRAADSSPEDVTIFRSSCLACPSGLLYRSEMTAELTPVEAITEFAADVRRSLQATPKQLPSKYLYDALGSHLFEAICQLPWYRITRAESALLDRFAAPMMAGLADPVSIVELGCGSGEKLAVLGEALRGRSGDVRVHLVDISGTALDLSERTLGRLPHLSVTGHRATYEAGLTRAAKLRPANGTMLVLFLGSNIGNLDATRRTSSLSRSGGRCAPATRCCSAPIW